MFFNKKGIVWRAVLVLFLLCTASPLMLHNLVCIETDRGEIACTQILGAKT